MGNYIIDVSAPYTSVKEIYYKRLYYRSTMQNLNLVDDHLVNFNFGEKCLYGRVNYTYVPIIVKPNYLISLKGTSNPIKELRAVDFVADAFTALQQAFRLAVAKKEISSEDNFLSNLTVFKAYENPQRLYTSYINTIQQVIKEQTQAEHIVLKDFSHFINTLYSYVERIAREQPFTYSAFIKSKLCPMNVSGLVIEIAEGDYNNDDEKFTTFMQSKNWNFYVSLCSNYGFMIDQNIPWRLVADIDSESMRKYSRQRGIESGRSFFNRYCLNTYYTYFINFRTFLLKLYNNIRPDTIFETYRCTDGTIKTKVSTPPSYTALSLENMYGEEYFLKLYFNIRLIEEESMKTDSQKKLFFEDCMKVYRSRGVSSALYIFERILNLPLDYVGSMNYYRKRDELLADIDAAEKGATVLPSSYSGGY